MKKSSEPQIFILLLLASFAAVSAVLYTPALPQITRNLGISSGQTQFSMTVFLIGYSLGNLPYGPFSNRYGRKPAIYMGILLAIVGTLLILFGGKLLSFWIFIFGRFVVGLGSCVGLKITFTMMGDIYPQASITKKMSRVMLAFAIAPGLAIFLGGLLTHHFGWESCFYFLTGYSFLLFFLSIFLPETRLETDPLALKLSRIKTEFLTKLKNKKLITCALMIGCGTSFIYLFATEAPFIGIGYIGLEANEYGYLSLIPPIGMIIGAFMAHYWAEKKDPLVVMRVGISIAILSALIMFLLFIDHQVNQWTLFIPMPFLFMGTSLIYSNALGLGMAHAKNKSIASALTKFINMGVCVIFLLLFGALPHHKIYDLPLVFLILGICLLALQLIFLRPKLHKNI